MLAPSDIFVSKGNVAQKKVIKAVEGMGHPSPKKHESPTSDGEALCRASEDEVSTPSPLAKSHPKLRPESRVRSIPVWQAHAIA